MKSKQEMNRLLYNVAVHCKTEEEANEVLKLADILGYTWCSGMRYTIVNNYDRYKENTCYYIVDGLFGHICRCEEGDKIISAQDFINLIYE